MRVDYQISEDDFVAAVCLARRRLLRVMVGVQILGGLMLAVTLIATLLRRVPQPTSSEWIVPALMVVLPFLIRRQFRQAFRKSPITGEQRTLRVDDAGIEFDSASARGHMAWSAYVSFVEDQRNFVLFQQGRQIFVPIPKREMTSTEITDLSSIFQTHIGHK